MINNKLALFEENEIRKVYKNNKWYYSITDVISMIATTKDPAKYLKKLKQKDSELNNSWNEICTPLNMKTKNDTIRKIQTTDTIGILRIIEDITSPKAENFKRWLARLGSERLEEISNPELAMDRMKKIYESKGYSSSWIEQREREITTRHSLKEEWHNRGITDNKDYMFLTNEIYQSGFDNNIKKHKDIKVPNDLSILKDSMTNLELALINLSETITIELHKKNNSRGLDELKKDINAVGKIIKNTKEEIENQLETKIVSNNDYIDLTNNH